MRPYTVYIMPKHFIDKMAHKCRFLLLHASLKMLQDKLSDECKGTIFFPCVSVGHEAYFTQVEPKEHITRRQQAIICCFHSQKRKILESVWINLGVFYVESAVMFEVKKNGGLYKMYKCSTSHHIKAMFPVMFYAKSYIFKVLLGVPFKPPFSIAFGFCLLLYSHNISPRKQKESRNAVE